MAERDSSLNRVTSMTLDGEMFFAPGETALIPQDGARIVSISILFFPVNFSYNGIVVNNGVVEEPVSNRKL